MLGLPIVCQAGCWRRWSVEGYGCEGDIYPIHRTGDFWSELARGSEGDLSTRGGDLRVPFQPTWLWGAKGALWGERGNECVIQLTDAGDFGRPRSQDFNLPTSVTLRGVLVRGFYTLIQLYSNQLTDVGDFGSRHLVVHLQTVLLEKNYVLITLLKK